MFEFYDKMEDDILQPQLGRQPHLVSQPHLVRQHHLVRQPHLVRLPHIVLMHQLVMLYKLVGLPHLVTDQSTEERMGGPGGERCWEFNMKQWAMLKVENRVGSRT